MLHKNISDRQKIVLALLGKYIRFKKTPQNTADRREIVPVEKQKVALQQITLELGLPSEFLQDAKINPNIGVTSPAPIDKYRLPEFYNKYPNSYNGYFCYNILNNNGDTFLGKGIDSLPVLLDLQNYKLTSIAELVKIADNYALSIVPECLPEDMEKILRGIKFFGVGEYSNYLDFVKKYVLRIIFTSGLVDKSYKVYGVYGTFAGLYTNGRLTNLLFPGSSAITFININLPSIHPELQKIIRPFEIIASLVHEAAHAQVNYLQAQGYAISHRENERYAWLMTAAIYCYFYANEENLNIKSYIYSSIKQALTIVLAINRAISSKNKKKADIEDFDNVLFANKDQTIHYNFNFNFNKEFLKQIKTEAAISFSKNLKKPTTYISIVHGQ